MTFIGHYTRKSPCNTAILKLLTRDRSVKFSHMVAAGAVESVYYRCTIYLDHDGSDPTYTDLIGWNII